MSEQKASSFPDHKGDALQRRLLAGDPVAPADLCVEYLDGLSRYLTGRFPRIEPEQCYTAAEDALLSFIREPGKFRPAKGTLPAYLRMAAVGDLKNSLRAAKPPKERDVSWQDVELSARLRNKIQDEGADPAHVVERSETQKEELERWREHTDGLSPLDERVLRLMLDEVRSTEAFAGILGVSHLPVAEQRRAVKRSKDRIKKHIQRRAEHE